MTVAEAVALVDRQTSREIYAYLVMSSIEDSSTARRG